MKKIVIGIIVLLLLFVGAIYLFIPSMIRVESITYVNTIPANFNKALHDTNSWKSWWPGQEGANNNFSSNGISYRLTRVLADGAELTAVKNNHPYPVRVQLIPLGNDSVIVNASLALTAGNSPFARLRGYKEAREFRNNLDTILKAVSNYAADTRNVYGFQVTRTSFMDTLLVATRFNTESYPSVDTIYKAIDVVRNKIAKDGAVERDFPMLNVKKKDSLEYEIMVAIAVNKPLLNEWPLFYSRMAPMKDRFLLTEVKGGPLTIKRAHEAIEHYMEDRLLTAPAIPFEILVTDRRQEKDSAKWVTKIYYPSM